MENVFQFTIHNSLFTILNEPIPLKYPDYHPEMRQWRQMRQMGHFFCGLVFSYLNGQQRVPAPKNRKSVAFCHTGVAGKLTLDYRRLRRGRQKTEVRSRKQKGNYRLTIWRKESEPKPAGRLLARAGTTFTNPAKA